MRRSGGCAHKAPTASARAYVAGVRAFANCLDSSRAHGVLALHLHAVGAIEGATTCPRAHTHTVHCTSQALSYHAAYHALHMCGTHTTACAYAFVARAITTYPAERRRAPRACAHACALPFKPMPPLHCIHLPPDQPDCISLGLSHSMACPHAVAPTPRSCSSAAAVAPAPPAESAGRTRGDMQPMTSKALGQPVCWRVTWFCISAAAAWLCPGCMQQQVQGGAGDTQVRCGSLHATRAGRQAGKQQAAAWQHLLHLRVAHLA
jgi:hypothetical protein